MPVEIVVAPASPFDAGLMAAIHKSCFGRPWDEAAMAQFLAGPGTLCLIGSVLDPNTAIAVGILIASIAADEAELLTLAVAPGFRRMGLGCAMLKTAMASLKESGAKTLFLEVEEGNDAALALYRSLGAGAVGRRAGYYEHGADAAIFSLAL